jgi:hypothetical protein
VRERPVNQDHADVGSAVRVLVEHGLGVVTESSDNSLPSLAVTTRRQQLVAVGPMEYAVLASVPELNGLLAVLKDTGNDSVVWALPPTSCCSLPGSRLAVPRTRCWSPSWWTSTWRVS